MKILILFISLFLISEKSFSKDPLSTTVEAVRKTEEGRSIEKKISKKGKKILEIIPPELIAISKLGIEQELDFRLDNQHNINLNYRQRSVSYKFELSF